MSYTRTHAERDTAKAIEKAANETNSLTTAEKRLIQVEVKLAARNQAAVATIHLQEEGTPKAFGMAVVYFQAGEMRAKQTEVVNYATDLHFDATALNNGDVLMSWHPMKD